MSKSDRRKPKPKHWDTAAPSPRDSSIQQEMRVSKELGAKLTPNSGAGFHKSDAKDVDYRYEMKETASKSLSIIKAGTLKKIWEEAVETGLRPAVVVTMTAIEEPCPQDWVLLTMDDFKALRGEEEE